MKTTLSKIRQAAGQSLQFQVLSLALLLTSLLAIVIGVFAYFQVIAVVTADTSDKLTAIAQVKENNLNRWVDEQKRNLVLIAALPEVRSEAGRLTALQTSPASRQQAARILSTYFTTVINTTVDVQEILLLDSSGVVLIASSPQHVGLTQAQETYFQNGLTSTQVTTFYFCALLNAPTITISTPLFDQAGRRVGVLASHLSLAAVDQIIRERNGLGESGEIYLVNPQRQLVSIDPLARQDNQWLSSKGIDAALARQTGSGVYANYAGLPVIGSYQWIAERDVALLVEINQAEALKLTRPLTAWNLAMSLVVIALSGLGTYFLVRRIIHPIQTLTQTATEIAAGNLDLKAPVTSSNEVGRLALAFNVMTHELKQSLRGLEELNNALEARVGLRTAELRASNRELESFSYSVSHDLRAPLRAISGYSRIMLNDFLPEFSAETRAMLTKINENAIYMGKLVDGLLAFSRLGRQSIRPQPLTTDILVNMVRKITQELQNDPKLAHVEMVIGSLPPCVADSLLLHQVYINLISNALKFSQNLPTARVEIGSTLTHQGPTYFVRDNGVGFDMQYAEKLFGVFQRLHHQHEFEGTGVGLAIVQRIIHRHQGEIWAEAAPGCGATFYFTLGLQNVET